MKRRTKIVCTLGPASSDESTIRELIEAGMDVARLNLSHGSHEYHKSIIDNVRRAAKDADKTIAILLDLQGPKLRVGEMEGGEVTLNEGDALTITSKPISAGTASRVFVNYPTLAKDVKIGGEILLDDGHLELRVTGFAGNDVETEVVVGGVLRSRKGVNLPNIRTSTPALTEKDLKDLEFGLANDVDILALSFVRGPSDVQQLVDRVEASGKNVMIIAKIEKPEAVESIDQIIKIAGGIMVARGDLGIEMRLSKVPGTQKSLIAKCIRAAKPVITATQMLESMIDSPRPTRAEVSDVANAVLDGSDALMLSGETAIGKYPVRTVEVMSDVIIEAERAFIENERDTQPFGDNPSTTEAVSRTASFLAAKLNAVAIVCLTASGTTARSIARHRPNVPVYAFTDDRRILGQLALSWGTKGFYLPFQSDTDKGIALVHDVLREQQLAQTGEIVILTAGMPLPAKGRTNMVHVSVL